MKLASFLVDGQERFGFLMLHPITGDELLVEPGKAETDMIHFAVAKTSGYQFSVPRFLSPEALAFDDEGVSGAWRRRNGHAWKAGFLHRKIC
ncbi:hypothetical protein [Cohnella rhizosphaerae]|uniref:Uncharacterized protein n=1 Tax=Cohnella rhizosphaerae TaxID=1457232 RepID=A0A9X4KP84_9BACL|nr:hypothetical protein [Cohnella rhizosphaerae]MDG0808205.1 hypothetical protein [Cohnella rhizosphaerae]